MFFGPAEATSFKSIKEGELEAIAPGGTFTTVDVTVESVLGQSPGTPSDRFTLVPGGPYHWYKSGGLLKEGESAPVVMFGGETNLSQMLVGEVNCRTVGAGTVENPGGGGAGVGRTTSLDSYEEGVEGGVNSVREKIGEPFVTYKTPSPPGMIRETNTCEITATHEVVIEAIYEGEYRPEIGVAKQGNLNGTKAGKPSAMRFGGGSTGTLESQASGEASALGSLKYLGYNEQELITVKQ